MAKDVIALGKVNILSLCVIGQKKFQTKNCMKRLITDIIKEFYWYPSI